MRDLIVALSLIVGLALVGPPALAQQRQGEVVITNGNVSPLPIAAPSFSGSGPHGEELAEIVRNDLGRSVFFAPIDPLRYVDRNVRGDVAPEFSNWKLIGSQYLLTGVTNLDPDGRIRVSFRLWDVNSQQELTGMQLTASAETWRRIGHKIADVIYQRLTGDSGYFDTRVIFVSESGPKGNRRSVLALMDQDGYNAQFPPSAAGQIFTPRFSADGRQVVYMALRDAGSQLYILDLETYRQEVLGPFEGMAFSPRFSPGGNKVAFSLSRYGNTDIFLGDARVGGASRLTSDPGIDTSPSFSPDGRQIAFNSDRAGSPQLYVMNSDGSGQRRLSTGAGRYTTPVWSPDGQMIAFTKQTGNQFHIGVMNADGTNERLLTTSYLDEGPTWAPNSRVLMFFRETPGGGSRLWTVDLYGDAQPAPYSGDGSDPSWSPLLE